MNDGRLSWLTRSTALDNSKCSAPAASSCLFSFPADASAERFALHDRRSSERLAYANGSLYGFDDDGSIVKITTGATRTATVIAVTSAAADFLERRRLEQRVLIFRQSFAAGSIGISNFSPAAFAST